MRELLEREKAISMYFCTGKGYKIISSELSVPLDTVKSWIRRYRIGSSAARIGEMPIKVDHTYKPRKKPLEKNDQDRIAKLEMEVDLLRNFLLEKERRSIKQ
jgi:transposase-like protein